MGHILCLNAGSSSLKFALFESVTPGEPQPLASGKIENIGLAPHLIAHDAQGHVFAEQRWASTDGATHESLLAGLLDRLEAQVGTALVAVGHRVVHGGRDFSAPVLVDEDVLERLDALCPLAPLHQPHNLAAIHALAAARPGLPQVACFDTAFHHGQPDLATRFALPRALDEEGVRRYGFHGMSYEYIARRMTRDGTLPTGGKVIAAHLGNGASLCALKDGRSIDTTMGFTALDGLMMGTRCGTLDPGAVLYLFQQKGMSPQAVEHLLYNESGLLGVSGLSSDMRELLASKDPRARQAVDLFTYQIARQAGALASSLGGPDSFVFTAGIGENAPEVRSRVCARLAWLGMVIDEDANRRNAPVISAADSPVTIRVIPTDEELMIAIHTTDLLNQTKGAS
jgi:acetate kinase